MNYKITSRFSVIVLLLLLTGNLHAQSKYRNQLKISPLRIVDVINPGYELSYERIYWTKFSTQLSIAYMMDPIHITSLKDYHGGRIALEEKYFYFHKTYFRTYFSAEIVVLKTDFKSIGRFVDTTGGMNISNYDKSYLDTFLVHKQTQSLNLKGGIQFTLKRITLDFSVGLGLKHKDIIQSQRFAPNDVRYTPISGIHNFSGSAAGNRYIINIPLNAKIGFLF